MSVTSRNCWARLAPPGPIQRKRYKEEAVAIGLADECVPNEQVKNEP